MWRRRRPTLGGAAQEAGIEALAVADEARRGRERRQTAVSGPRVYRIELQEVASAAGWAAGRVDCGEWETLAEVVEERVGVEIGPGWSKRDRVESPGETDQCSRVFHQWRVGRLDAARSPASHLPRHVCSTGLQPVILNAGADGSTPGYRRDD